MSVRPAALQPLRQTSWLDALRWGRADLHTLIPDGDARVRAVIESWGLRWPEGA